MHGLRVVACSEHAPTPPDARRHQAAEAVRKQDFWWLHDDDAGGAGAGASTTFTSTTTTTPATAGAARTKAATTRRSPSKRSRRAGSGARSPVASPSKPLAKRSGFGGASPTRTLPPWQDEALGRSSQTSLPRATSPLHTSQVSVDRLRRSTSSIRSVSSADSAELRLSGESMRVRENPGFTAWSASQPRPRRGGTPRTRRLNDTNDSVGATATATATSRRSVSPPPAPPATPPGKRRAGAGASSTRDAVGAARDVRAPSPPPTPEPRQRARLPQREASPAVAAAAPASLPHPSAHPLATAHGVEVSQGDLQRHTHVFGLGYLTDPVHSSVKAGSAARYAAGKQDLAVTAHNVWDAPPAAKPRRRARLLDEIAAKGGRIGGGGGGGGGTSGSRTGRQANTRRPATARSAGRGGRKRPASGRPTSYVSRVVV